MPCLLVLCLKVVCLLVVVGDVYRYRPEKSIIKPTQGLKIEVSSQTSVLWANFALGHHLKTW